METFLSGTVHGEYTGTPLLLEELKFSVSPIVKENQVEVREADISLPAESSYYLLVISSWEDSESIWGGGMHSVKKYESLTELIKNMKEVRIHREDHTVITRGLELKFHPASKTKI